MDFAGIKPYEKELTSSGGDLTNSQTGSFFKRMKEAEVSES
jgi:hypothetical protein